MFNQTHPADVAVLQNLVRDKRVVVEIGTFTGGTAEHMLEAMPEDGHLITIDPFRAFPKTDFMRFERPEVIMSSTWRLSKFGSRCTQIIGESATISGLFANATVDMVFIDGNHSWQAVCEDIRGWSPKIRDGGVISGHDYNRELADKSWGPSDIELASMDRSPISRLHYGVALALNLCFDRWSCSEEAGCTVWWADPRTLKPVSEIEGKAGSARLEYLSLKREA